MLFIRMRFPRIKTEGLYLEKKTLSWRISHELTNAHILITSATVFLLVIGRRTVEDPQNTKEE